jgi:hypothetical protein
LAFTALNELKKWDEKELPPQPKST